MAVEGRPVTLVVFGNRLDKCVSCRHQLQGLLVVHYTWKPYP